MKNRFTIKFSLRTTIFFFIKLCVCMHLCTHLQNPQWKLKRRCMQMCRKFYHNFENQRCVMQILLWIMDSLYKVGARVLKILDDICMKCQWTCAHNCSNTSTSTRTSKICECMCEHPFSELPKISQANVHEPVHTFDRIIKISWCILKCGAHVCTNLQNPGWYVHNMCMNMCTTFTDLF